MKDIHFENIKNQFFKICGSFPESITLLPQSGSNRKYYRVIGNGTSLIGVISEDQKENNAFISFSRSFGKLDLPVPQILSVAEDGKSYLQTDLGDQTLFDFLKEKRNTDIFPLSALEKYKQVLT